MDEIEMTLERWIDLLKAAKITKSDWDDLACVFHETPMIVPKGEIALVVICPPYTSKDVDILNEKSNEIRESLLEEY